MIKRNGLIFHVLKLEELILLQWPYYPKQSIDSNVIPIKLPMKFSQDCQSNREKRTKVEI